MTHLRFVLVTAALFAAAFAGVFFGMPWASKGFPVMAKRAAPPKPETRPPAVGTQAMQNDVLSSNLMRMTTIQAADAYALSPCDQASKAAFVVAVSTYLRATTGKTADDGAFTTPMDARVHDAIGAAFAAGGITPDEFPAGTQLWQSALAKPASAAAPCGAARQAERRSQ